MSTTSIKRLIIVRHAKAAWDYDDINDYNRPLTDTGKICAALIGSFIKEKQGAPCLMITSSAKRAISTTEIVANQVSYPIENIITNDSLYLAWSPAIMEILKSTPKEIETCIMIGHNPGVTDLINDLGVRLDHLPTASAVCFEFNTDKWDRIYRKNATLKWFQQIKDLR